MPRLITWSRESFCVRIFSEFYAVFGKVKYAILSGMYAAFRFFFSEKRKLL